MSIEEITNGEQGVSVRAKLNSLIAVVNQIERRSGWADYTDTTYNSGSPFSVQADTDTTLINGAQISQTQELPEDYEVSGFFNPSTQKILGQAGDGLLITVECVVERQSGTGEFNFDTWFDIGGAIPDLYRRGFRIQGNTPRTLTWTSGVYTLDTWEANGADVFVNSSVAVNIYGIRYVIHRIHKGVGTYG